MKLTRWAILAAIPFLAALLPGCAHHYYRHSTWMPPPRLHIADYHFEFSLLADTVIPYQRWWMRVAVTNLTGETQPAPDIYSDDNVFDMEFTDDEGHGVRITRAIDMHTSWANGTLAAGEKLVTYGEMGWRMWHPLLPLDTSLVGKQLRMIITLYAGVFADSVIPDSSAYEPKVCPFVTARATGDDAEATRLYLQGYDAIEKKDFVAADDSLHAILTRYPNSRLVESVFYELQRITGTGLGRAQNPTTGFVVLFEDLLNRRPNSPLLIYFLREFDRSKGYSKELHNALVREIASRKPDAAALEQLKIIP